MDAIKNAPGNGIFHGPGTAETQRPFFDGSCLFLNGYPVSHSNERMLPIPLSWRVDKNTMKSGETFTIFDFAVEKNKSVESPKGLGEDFAHINKTKVELDSPDRFMQVHNASQRRGVKKAGDSFVYRYEALAEGQIFEAIIAGEGSHKLCEDLKNSNWPGVSAGRLSQRQLRQSDADQRETYDGLEGSTEQ